MVMPDFDIFVASAMQEARGQLGPVVITFAHDIVEECVLVERSCGMNALQHTIRLLQKVGGNANAGGGGDAKVMRLLERLQERQAAGGDGGAGKGAAASQQQQHAHQQQQRAVDPAVISATALPVSAFQRANDPPAFRQRATRLLMSWIDIMTSSQGALKQDQFGGFMARLNDEGVLRGEENCANFFRITTELCVESYFNARRDPNMNPAFSYNAIDAYARLAILIVFISDRQTAKLSLLHKAIDASKSVMMREYELRRSKNIEGTFDQRPYFRLFLGLQRNLAELVLNPKDGTSSPIAGETSGLSQQDVLAFLTPFVDLYYTHLRPSVMPTFAFSWLELISHESFMPRLLGGSAAGAVGGGVVASGNANMEQGGGVALERLLVALLEFLKPFLHNAEMPAVINRLYTGTLRLLLVLLHDFPGFLCAFHYSLCDVIPSSCVQLRNLILSAFPRSMRLPDPFTPNLNVELLPEVALSPLVLAQYEQALQDSSMYNELDNMIKTWRSPSPGGSGDGLPASASKTIQALCAKIQSGGEGAKYNHALINSVVMFAGLSAVRQAQQEGKSAHTNLAGSAAVSLVQGLLGAFDAQGRYLVLNALANQLRFPNSHTHYFSSVLLFLFGEADTLERVREQVTRVLLERLIVHRPHPWGLLITFIELIKNKKYNFWSHGFVRCAPEIDKLFESVARSCMQGQEAPTAAAGGASGALGNGM
jgi:CCR4-NOT transcription complex subunit 1